MRLHRFFVGDERKLTHDFWINDSALIHQWQKVFRLAAGAEVVLFDGKDHDRLYQIAKFEPGGVHLKHVTDFERVVPQKHVYLLWSLLKKDKNDWIIQKATELGVSHFWPVITKRSEQPRFDMERAKKIAIEAAEQCGRSDIPTIREPELLQTAIDNFSSIGELFVCQQGHENQTIEAETIGILVGPEGGWAGNELEQFKTSEIKHLGLGEFTLRAETAAIVASTVVLQ